MRDIIEVIVLTASAGAAIPIGGALARIERVRPEWLEQELRHAVIAFGGGILLSAVTLVLVPEGVKGLPLMVVAAALCLGGLVFCLLDVGINRAKTSAAQMVAMLSDFIPEALALGAMFAADRSFGVLLALLIGLQNLPEGFNAYRELSAAGRIRGSVILLTFVALVPIGPLAGLIGLYWLTSYPKVIHVIMLFAGGGILYLTFQDIAPQAKLERHWTPALGAVVGFLFGLVGQLLLVAR